MDQNYIKSLSDKELIKSTERAVDNERKAAQVVIWHLQEIQNRKLYLTMEFADMYECLIGHFKMSDTTAYGRLKVLKIMDDIPQVDESLRSGELNISNLALAHSFIEKHHKKTGEELSQDDKFELMSSIKNKTTAEVRELLATFNPDMALPHDEIRPLTATHSQMKSTISKELVKKIEYLKALISHVNPTHEELLSMAVDALIEQAEKKKGVHQKETKNLGRTAVLKQENQNVKMRNTKDFEGNEKEEKEEKEKEQENDQEKEISQEVIKGESVYSPEKIEGNVDSKSMVPENSESTQCLTDGNSRYVSKSIKRFVFERAQGQCEHIYPSGKRCSSQFQTQFDHVVAFSKGGKTIKENIQLLCRAHNAAKGSS